MKTLVRIVALLVAGIGTANAGWYTNKIDRMQLSTSGLLSVYFSTGPLTECGSNRIDFYGDFNTASFKYIYAALLSYEAQKDSVQFLITSCSGTTGIFQNIESSVGL